MVLRTDNTVSAAGATGAAGSGGRIMLAHGGGGQLTDSLIAQTILPRLGNDVLRDLLDAAIMEGGSERLALTIDGYVVQPWRFPGGDIGRLAVSGTVNDLAVCGARPVGLALGMIVCEGFAVGDLDGILRSVAETAAEAGVSVVTGDTKVVGRDQGDGIYLTTAGVGVVRRGLRLHPDQVRPGDVLIINGPIAEHGLAVMLARQIPDMSIAVRSDVSPLSRMIERVLEAVPDDVVFMRDPTRGGLAGAAADLATRSGLRVVLEETAIPVSRAARHAAEMLGIDVLDVANEGKVLIVARPGAAERVLAVLREDRYGAGAAVIGRVEEARDGICELRTLLGGRRIVQKPYGEQLPRIC